MSALLAGRRVLVTEDIYLVAMMLCEAIKECGAKIVGPFPTNAACLAAIDSKRIDAAVLDIGLSDGHVFPVARKLRDKGIPFLFVSGYDISALPAEFATTPHLTKPCSNDEVCETLAHLVSPSSPQAEARAP